MGQKTRLNRLLRKMLLALLAIYLAVVLGVFLYFTKQRDVITGIYAADHFVVTGPVRRLLSPMESDLSMIDRFRRDRASFEKLVEIHRLQCFTDLDPLNNSFGEYPEVSVLKKKLGIVKLRSGTGEYWLSNPYSLEARDASNRMSEELLTLPFPAKHRKSCQYTAPRFYLAITVAHLARKGLIYYPVAPTVDRGMLLRPSAAGAPVSYERVLPSLDSTSGVPARHPLECAYRRIEPQWYLFVC